ncbi:MAG: tetratricopeptide repeat protein [Candidatus Sericytochromatia bacterium]|nr:tetratricopeptide repeat protein [Candidatus Sericytochromatia bacterium]
MLRARANRVLGDLDASTLRVHDPAAFNEAEWTWLRDSATLAGHIIILADIEGSVPEHLDDLAVDANPPVWLAPREPHGLFHTEGRALDLDHGARAAHLDYLARWAEALDDAHFLDATIAAWRLVRLPVRSESRIQLLAARRELACGNPVEALRLLERWQPDTASDRLDRRLTLATVLEFLGDYQGADRVLAHTKEYVAADSWEIRAQQAVLQVRTGLHEALIATSKLLPLSPQAVSSLDRATWASCLGIAHFRLGQYAEALTWHEEALAIRSRADSTVAVARSLNNIGNVHLERGALDEAREAFDDAETRIMGTGEVALAAAIANNKASLLLLMNLVEAARESANRALTLKDESGEAPGKAIARTTLAAVELAAGRLDEARNHAWEARMAIESMNLQENLPDIEVIEAELALAEGATHKARSLFLETLHRHGASRPAMLSRIHRGLARCAMSIGSAAAVSEHLGQALSATDRDGRRHERDRTLALFATAGLIPAPCERS